MVVPTKPIGFADGLPADHPLDLWIVFLLVGGFFIAPWSIDPPRVPRLALVLLAVGLLKLALATTSLPHGLVARYYANPDFQGPPEASIEYRLPGATRIDRTIDFAPVGFGWGVKPFPLWFFNDIQRFNFFKSGEPDRKRLPFSVRWDGFVKAPTTEPLTWRLATDQEATLGLLGQSLLSTAEGRHEATLALRPGWHPVSLTYVWRGRGPRSLRLEWGRQGEFRPVPSSALLPLNPGPRADWWDQRTAPPAWVVFVLQFLVAAWIVAIGLRGVAKEKLLTEKTAVYFLVLVMMAFGTISLAKRGRAPNWNFLNGGDDPLVYETAARQIIIQRDLLNRTENTQPFYFTVGCRYFLAASHALMGPSKAMVVMLQYTLLAFTCALLFYTMRRLVPPWMALFAAAVFFSGHAGESIYRWPTDLFPAVMAFLLCASLFAQLALCQERPTWKRAAGAGLLFGLACIMRPNIIVFGPVAFFWLLFNRGRPKRQNLAAAFTLAVVATLTISPVTMRNWYVSGRFVLLNDGGAINFWQGNQPPKDIDLTRVGNSTLYKRLGLKPMTQEVFEYMRQRPLAFLAGFGTKSMDVLGLPPYFSLSLIALHLAYLLGAISHWRWGQNRWLATLLHGFVLSQWAILIVLKPGPHEPKNQLPTFLVAFPFAAILLATAAERAFSARSVMPFSDASTRRRSALIRSSACLMFVAFLAAITYPPRLPFIVLLLTLALWYAHRKSTASLSPLDL